MKQAPDNIRRAEEARKSLDRFTEVAVEIGGYKWGIPHLIASLMHLADLEGIGGNDVVTRAMSTYDAESSDNFIKEGDNDPT